MRNRKIFTRLKTRAWGELLVDIVLVFLIVIPLLLGDLLT